MTDLVERLKITASVRSWAEADEQRNEAADEIERLRAEVAALTKDAERYQKLVESAYVWGRLSPIECTTQGEDVALWIKGNISMDKAGIDAAVDAAMKEKP